MNNSTAAKKPPLLRGAMVALAVLTLAAAPGCSFVASSKSSSKVVSSPFTSSAKSSGAGAESASYQAEAASYARAFAQSGDGSAATFQRGLSRIAAEQGVSDWEASAATWTSVGRGLAQAQLSRDEADERAQEWAGGRPELAALVLQGYTGAL